MLISKRCSACGGDAHVEVPDVAYHAWRGGMLAQEAFHDLSPEIREQIISGTHPACWNTLFQKED